MKIKCKNCLKKFDKYYSRSIYCAKCKVIVRKRQLVIAVSKRRKKLKLMAIEYMGGACKNCGYNKYPEVLEFHHPKSNHKDFGISEAGTTKSWKRIKKELDKCIMLCANCHREAHIKMHLNSK